MTTDQNKSPPAHTALPWLYDAQTAEIYIPDDEHEPCDVIADMEVLKTPSHHANANGEFIVRACNSHYELADALLDLHRYGQTDFSYLQSPAAAKTHRALVNAGYLIEDGTIIAIANARGQQ